MEHLKKTIFDLLETGKTKFQSCNTREQLETIKTEFLGRKGSFAQLMPLLKDASTEDKRDIGPLLNNAKQELEELYVTRSKELRTLEFQAQEEKQKYFDVTAYKPGQLKGSLHPYTHVSKELASIFTSMGYRYADGPEVETEYYNFDALNIPANHPARDMQDTFWLTLPHMLMRTHTSTVQIRTMQQQTPPLAIFSMGRVYRQEATDASHDYMFQQVEGLFIDTDVSMAHLLATLKTFLRLLLKDETLNLRVRPSYFPFVEPGIEVDVSCPFCTTGCSTCKQTRWIEMGGAGLVHPHVLKAGNIDPEIYSGFAFGFGLTRLTMLKYGISDIRLLHSGQVSFLEQF